MAIFALYSINDWFCITEVENVYNAICTESLYKTGFVFKGLIEFYNYNNNNNNNGYIIIFMVSYSFLMEHLFSGH
jgi:hypothetical protein